MTADKKESTVRSLEMSQLNDRAPLSVKLTPLLISRGLVKGTTLTFGLRLLSRSTQDIVLYAPDGSVVAVPRQASLF